MYVGIFRNLYLGKYNMCNLWMGEEGPAKLKTLDILQ